MVFSIGRRYTVRVSAAVQSRNFLVWRNMFFLSALLKKLPPLRLRILLFILFFMFGMIPVLCNGGILTRSFSQEVLDTRKNEMQNRSSILATELSRSGYLHGQTEGNTALDNEMDAVASIYNGRILLVDKDYRIVRDSFQISAGKFYVVPEVLRAFRGEKLTTVNENDKYVVQSMPVYDGTAAESTGMERSIDGVLLFIGSTAGDRNKTRSTKSRLFLFNVLMLFIVAFLSLLVSGGIMRPLEELRASLLKVAEGDLNQNVSQESYVVTKELSDAVNATLEKLKAVDQSRDEFVSNVSHELKTPITSIRVLADSIMGIDDAPLELYQDFMNDISKEIDREAAIIDDLLTLVRLDRSGFRLQHKPTDMHAMLEQILKRLRPIARLNNIEMTLETIREVSADVDEVTFSLAITNLVENAVKYNIKDGWVKVSLDADHQFCYIRVEDSGIGIPEDQQELVYERFYRVDKARSRATGGTGLGLAFTRKIVHMHQGIVRLTSKVGEGSQFLVRIPLNHIENSTPESATERTTDGRI